MTFYSPDHPAPFTPGRALVVGADFARGGEAVSGSSVSAIRRTAGCRSARPG